VAKTQKTYRYHPYGIHGDSCEVVLVQRPKSVNHDKALLGTPVLVALTASGRQECNYLGWDLEDGDTGIFVVNEEDLH